MLLTDLVAKLNTYLNSNMLKDYCPNGLQVEGKSEVNKIVSGVSANQAMIDAAVAAQADLLLVHHGFFFKGEPQPIVDIKKQRIATLLQHDISLVSYHLPLDVHPVVGNNVLLGAAMGWEQQEVFTMLGVEGLGRAINLETAIAASDLRANLAQVLQQEPIHIVTNDAKPIKKIAWCTGAAQDGIVEAYYQGADAFISGEISERTVAQAKEYGVHYFACGHHATERFGARALGEYCAANFGLQHEFIDILNPI